MRLRGLWIGTRRSLPALAVVLAAPLAHAMEAPVIADVVVTARQRAETVQQAPLAVRAITAERIADLRPVQLSDLSGAAPNFSIERAAGLDTVFIRGVGGGGRNIGFGARTAVYLDGVYVAQVGALNRSLADSERVEVLRGPQGALFGRNTVSGAVDIVSRAPGDRFGGEARAWAGSRRDFGGYLGVDLPVGSAAALRLSGLRETRDGFTRNSFDGSRKGGDVDVGSYRAALRLRPTPALTLDLSVDYALDRSLRDGFEAVSNTFGGGLTDPSAPARLEINENMPRIRRNEQSGTALRAVYALGGGATVTSISAYRITSRRQRSDTDYSPRDVLSTDYHDHSGQLSQELRLASADTGRLRYIVGLFYLHEAASSERVAAFGRDTLAVGLPVAPGAVVPVDSRIGTDSSAVFGSLDYRLAPDLTLGAGLRLNRDRRRLAFNLDGSQSGALRIATLRNFHDQRGEDSATPSLTLTYAPRPALSAYARYAEGFKSGGWNADFLNTAQAAPPPGATTPDFAFGPERVHAYEAGLKARTWKGRLALDLAVFRMEFRDYQINKFMALPGGGTVIQLTNASSAHSSGVEVSADLRANDLVRLTFDAAALDAKFGAFPGGGAAGADATGARLPYAPRFSARLGVELAAPLPPEAGKAVLFVDARHRSFVFTGQENLLSESVPAYTVFDAKLSWRPAAGAFELALWARNLTDIRYRTNATRDFLGARVVSWGDPRTVGAEVSGRF